MQRVRVELEFTYDDSCGPSERKANFDYAFEQARNLAFRQTDRGTFGWSTVSHVIYNRKDDCSAGMVTIQVGPK